MSSPADKHDKLLSIWNERGREPVIPVPQYERPDYGFMPARVKEYVFRESEVKK